MPRLLRAARRTGTLNSRAVGRQPRRVADHGAEIALSVFTKPCLDRRIDNIDTLRSEAKARADRRNASAAIVDWQFTTDNARIKLEHLYPQLKEERGTGHQRARNQAPLVTPLTRCHASPGAPRHVPFFGRNDKRNPVGACPDGKHAMPPLTFELPHGTTPRTAA